MSLKSICRRVLVACSGGGDIGRLTVLIAAALCFFGLLILGTIAFAGWSSNEIATQRERTLVENALNRAIARSLDEQKSVAWWDDSITHLKENAFDYDFADANFGIFLTETYSHDEVFILNGDNKPIYGFRHGERQTPKAFEDLRPAIAPVIAQARGEKIGLRQRPDIFSESQAKYRVLSGASRSASWSGHLITIGGKPAVVAALTIVPNVDMSLMPAKPQLLVSVRYIDSTFISEIGRSLLLPGLTIGAGEARTNEQVAEPFVTDDGVSAGDLIWTTRQPGRPLLLIILPMAVIGLLAAGLFFRSMFANLKKASGDLADREAQARHESKHDALSGLPNRVHFAERLNSFLRQSAEDGSKAVAAYIDVDRFKDINDTLGHRAGDHLIKAVATRLQSVLAPGDFLARFGGDEFAILCIGADEDDVRLLNERIRDAFSSAFPLEGQRICVTASVGLAIAPDDGDGVDQLMRHADIALYRAKAAGRDQAVLFSAEMEREVQERRATELDLRTAMSSDQLALHYQPIISCGSHRLTGVEALLRWKHPERGYIGPGVFIPIAEETGLMPELGEWIMSQAMRDAARWPGIEIAVNLSPVQIRHMDLLSMLTRLVDEHKVDPKRFVLEITEGVLLDHSEHSLRTLAGVRALGFKTSLDDFGTGYSSLSYLCKFQFDKIKIDRSFVTGKADGTSRTIVQAVATLGRGIGVSVVAEGVETDVDALMMTQLGCTEMQGYYFSRPVPAEEIEPLIEKHNGDPMWALQKPSGDVYPAPGRPRKVS